MAPDDLVFLKAHLGKNFISMCIHHDDTASIACKRWSVESAIWTYGANVVRVSERYVLL